MQVTTLYFDINETLLDLTPLNTSIANALGGRPDLVPLWFSNLLHYSIVESVTDHFHPFGEIGVAVLKMVAENNNVWLSDEQAKEAILKPITQLPAHQDVSDSLNLLRQKGYQLVALSNSSNVVLTAQLDFAKLTQLFHFHLSVESINTYKPLPSVYSWATQTTQTEPTKGLMIASHHWDLIGAKRIGLNTAFIRRSGKGLYPLAPQPDLVVDNLIQLSEKLPSY